MSKNSQSGVRPLAVLPGTGANVVSSRAQEGRTVVSIASRPAVDVRVLAHEGPVQAFEHVVRGQERSSLVVLVPSANAIDLDADLQHNSSLQVLGRTDALEVYMGERCSLEAGLARRAAVRCGDGGRVSLVSCREAEITCQGDGRVSTYGAFNSLTVAGGAGVVLHSHAQVNEESGLRVVGDVKVGGGLYPLGAFSREAAGPQTSAVSPPSPPRGGGVQKAAKRSSLPASHGVVYA